MFQYEIQKDIIAVDYYMILIKLIIIKFLQKRNGKVKS